MLPEPSGPADTEPYLQGPPGFPDGPHPPPHGGDPHLNATLHLGQPQPPPRLDSEIHCLAIVGQIEGHLVLPSRNKTTKYEHVMPQLVAIEENPRVKGLLVLLNTVGGDIEAGLAIAELIRSLSKPTVSLVLGGGHSIGAPIAVAADYSFLAETATITIHPIRLTGLVIGVPQTYEYLDKMQDRVIRFIVANSRISEQRLRELMFRTGELVRDVGTVLVGREAVNVGLIREVGGLSQALSRLHALVHDWEAAGRRKPPHQVPFPPGGQGQAAPLAPFRPMEPVATEGWPR